VNDGRTFVQLDRRRHDRNAFDCGREPLNRFLREKAAKHAELGVSRTLVLPDPNAANDAPAPLVAFFTIAPGSIDRAELPPSRAKRLPHYPVPVFLLGQLGVASAFHGQGFGSIALGAALGKFAAMHAELHAHAVVVDCLDEPAERFYRHQGFQPLDGVVRAADDQVRMFLPMRDVLALFGASH